MPQVRAYMPWGKAKIDTSKYLTEIAKREPFRVTVTERGTLASLSNASLVSNVEGSTTIVEIVPEGTIVKAPIKTAVKGTVTKIAENESLGQDMVTITVEDEEGNDNDYSIELGEHTRVLVKEGESVTSGDLLAGDVVCELDASTLVDKELQQQIKVTQAEADLEKAKKNVEIQKTQNASDIAAATLARDLAQLDLTKYKDGEYVQQRDTLAGQIKQNQEELATSEDDYEFTERNANKGYVPLAQLEQKRIAVLRARIQLATTEGQLRLLEKYDYSRQIKEYEHQAEELKRELDRVRLAGEAALSQFEADLEAKELTYSVEANQLDRLRRQIKASILVAPQAGEVVYANQSSRRSEPVVIEAGATVRERQAVINLPDLSQMKVDARIHESKISQIAAGQTVLIRVDAYPTEVLRGVIETVSSVPLQGSWPNTDLKEYEAEIKIIDESKVSKLKLKPGLTAGLEIEVGNLRQDVLQIPVQAVITVSDSHFTYVLGDDGATLTEIEVGESNDQRMEILGGIEEGDAVVMNPRTHFADALSKLENELLKEKKDAQDKSDAADAKAQEAKGKSKGPAKAPGKGPAKAAGGPPAGGAPGGFDPAAIFKARDLDGDGKITLEEAEKEPSGRMKDGFSRMDADGDGAITLDEWNQAMQRFQSGGGR